MEQRSVATILLNYKTREDVIRLAEGRSQRADATVIIVDNGSDPELWEWCDDHSVEYIDTGENIGYTGGNNVGLKKAKELGFEYGFVLNPDVTLKRIDFYEMAKVMHDNTIDIMFPTVYDGDGGLQNDLPTFENRFLRKAGFLPELPESHDSIQYVDHGPGSAMMIHLSALDLIGNFRQEYFMYGEENDLCYRARRAGLKVAVYQSAEVIHGGTASGEDDSQQMSEFQMYYFIRNRFIAEHILYTNTHIYKPMILLYLIVYLITICTSGSVHLLRPYVLGIVDGMQNKNARRRYP